jgi:hypothetical protein
MGCPRVGPLAVVETATMLDPLGRPGGAETIAGAGDSRQSGIEQLSTGTDNAPSPSSRSEILGGLDEVWPNRVIDQSEREHHDIRFKRLEKGTFQFPEAKGGRVEVTPAEMAAVLEGIDLRHARRLPRFALPEPQPA